MKDRGRETAYSPIGLTFKSDSESSINPAALKCVQIISALPTEGAPEPPEGGAVYVVEYARIHGNDEVPQQHDNDLDPYRFVHIVLTPYA